MFPRVIIGLSLIVITYPIYAACGVLCTCSVLAGGSMDFGTNFSPLQTGNTDTPGSFTIRCTAVIGGVSADYRIDLNEGNSGSYTSRTMLKGGIPLSYNLYTTAARSVIWGNGTAGTGFVSGSLPIIILGGTNQIINVYGRITGPQPSVTPGGTYSDSITITVTY